MPARFSVLALKNKISSKKERPSKNPTFLICEALGSDANILPIDQRAIMFYGRDASIDLVPCFF